MPYEVHEGRNLRQEFGDSARYVVTTDVDAGEVYVQGGGLDMSNRAPDADVVIEGRQDMMLMLDALQTALAWIDQRRGWG